MLNTDLFKSSIRPRTATITVKEIMTNHHDRLNSISMMNNISNNVNNNQSNQLFTQSQKLGRIFHSETRKGRTLMDKKIIGTEVNSPNTSSYPKKKEFYTPKPFSTLTPADIPNKSSLIMQETMTTSTGYQPWIRHKKSLTNSLISTRDFEKTSLMPASAIIKKYSSFSEEKIMVKKDPLQVQLGGSSQCNRDNMDTGNNTTNAQTFCMPILLNTMGNAGYNPQNDLNKLEPSNDLARKTSFSVNIDSLSIDQSMPEYQLSSLNFSKIGEFKSDKKLNNVNNMSNGTKITKNLYSKFNEIANEMPKDRLDHDNSTGNPNGIGSGGGGGGSSNTKSHHNNLSNSLMKVLSDASTNDRPLFKINLSTTGVNNIPNKVGSSSSNPPTNKGFKNQFRAKKTINYQSLNKSKLNFRSGSPIKLNAENGFYDLRRISTANIRHQQQQPQQQQQQPYLYQQQYQYQNQPQQQEIKDLISCKDVGDSEMKKRIKKMLNVKQFNLFRPSTINNLHLMRDIFQSLSKYDIN